MSEGDVSLIRDEDVLRRMWQQTEDFSRKKEIRAHMYRLREERLRSLYSPEPGAEGKGCEFTSTQGHVKSFADQSFQSMKSKEVRDAGSPPKEFTYRGQDLKELSNAGWNVESENRTTDDGHTHVKSVQANIEGKYDVEGGRGQFSAIDQHKQAVTEYDDGNSSLRRNESASNTAAHEQVVRKTDDGTQFSSTTSSSTSTSKFQQFSSTNESVPYVTNNDSDLSQQISDDNKRHEELTSRRITHTNDYEQNLRSDYEHGEVVSRKVEYPDDNTKVVVETRRLPDGTKVTSTRREFRAPVVQRSEHVSQQNRRESNTSYFSTHKSHVNQSSKTKQNIDNTTSSIVDSQRVMDDFDFNIKHHVDNVTTHKNDEYIQSTKSRINDKKYDESEVDYREIISTRDNQKLHQNIEETRTFHDNEERIQKVKRDNKHEDIIERKISSDQYQTTYQADFTQKKISSDWSPSHQAWASTLRSDTPTRPSTRASSPGSKTFKSSNSSLRSSVSPDKIYRKPASRSGSPNKIDKYSPTRTILDRYSSHSTHSMSEIKTTSYTSPETQPQHTRSPTRSSPSPNRKREDNYHSSSISVSPEKRVQSPSDKSRGSPDRKPPQHDNIAYPRKSSSITLNEKQVNKSTPMRSSPSPDRTTIHEKILNNNDHNRRSPKRSSLEKTPPRVLDKTVSPARSSMSPERKPPHDKLENISSSNTNSPVISSRSKSPNVFDNNPSQSQGYIKATASSKPKSSIGESVSLTKDKTKVEPIKQKNNESPERKSQPQTITKVKDEHYKFIDEETKMYTRTESEQQSKTARKISSPFKDIGRPTDGAIDIKPDSIATQKCPTLVTQSPSPDSPNEKEQIAGVDYLASTTANISSRRNSPSSDNRSRQSVSPARKSPLKDVPAMQHEKTSSLIQEEQKKNTTSADRYSPLRDSSPSKREPNRELRHSNSHDSRSTSPRSSITKETSPDKLASVNQISQEFTTSSIHSELSKTSRRKTSESPEKHVARAPSPGKKTVRENTTNSRTKSPTNTVHRDKSSSPNKVSSRGTSPVKKTFVDENDTKMTLGGNRNLNNDTSSLNKHFKGPSPVRNDGVKEVTESTLIETTTFTDIKQSDKTTKKSSLLTRQSPAKDSTDYTTGETPNKSQSVLRNTSRSPSPSKNQFRDTRYDTYIKTDNIDYKDNIEISKSHEMRDNVTQEHHHTSVTNNSKDPPSRGTSPSKCSTNYRTQKINNKGTKSEIIYIEKDTASKKSSSPVRDSIPSKLHTKVTTENVNTIKDTKYQQATDFLDVERKTETSNKHIITKERPKQLVTPSTSPTRKSKGIESQPSTGQSSPTTTVSGFIYFSSPRADNPVVTDLDEHELDSDSGTEEMKIYKKPDMGKSSRSQSPSKIPCRSPSPDKRTIKESLPRKSSLKKPSLDNNQISPTEKPPSSFSVSPMVESKEFLQNQPDDKIESSKPLPKAKPPLERRETYEERCRKILGMSEQTTTETTIKKEDKSFYKQCESNGSSPSVSPCRSPAPYGEIQQKETAANANKTVTDFLERERDVNESPLHSDRHLKGVVGMTQTLSRETSPSKLKDVVSKTDKKTQEKQSSTSHKSPERIPKEQNSTARPYSFPSPTHINNNNNQTFNDACCEESNSGHPNQQTNYERNLQSTKTETSNLSLIQKEKNTAKSTTNLHKNKNESLVKNSKEKSPTRTQRTSSPEKIIKQTITSNAITSTEYNLSQTTETIQSATVTDVIEDEFITPRSSLSPTRDVPEESRKSYLGGHLTKSRDNKTEIECNDYNTEFITSEIEQDVPEKLLKSQRKRSPDPFNSPSNREKSPSKLNKYPTSSQSQSRSHNTHAELKTSNVQTDVKDNDTHITRKDFVHKDDNINIITKSDKHKEPRVSSKPPSRNVSPVKKNINTHSKPDSPESPSKTRSISPKKLDRPQSPKIGSSKSRDQIPSHIRKASPNPTSPTRIDKTMEKHVVDAKKTSAVKQNSFTKISTNKVTSKTNPSAIYKTVDDAKQQTTPKGINKENMNPKKESDAKGIRTTDITFKTKKIPTQKTKSKPEIQVSDMSSTKAIRQPASSTKTLKYQPKECHMNFPTSKPKSATALNTSTEEDDVIVDVQQAKSSRENSPDRICPTPVSFLEDVGTPRFPDEVSEPDDEFSKRIHHTIHESESIVDDIVEICEDDELFVRHTDVDKQTDETEKYVLNVNEKVSKFNNKTGVVDNSTRFKNVEKKVHSDFNNENIQPDECLLSVSEKVNKFANGPRDTKDNRSPSRNIVDEYDQNTTYQDNYTKLSVNDKANLFVETAESIKISKPKLVQKLERPDFSDIDDSLKSDDCLLSVSDKVNKFVKTAEQFLSETHEIEEKEKRIKEEHEKVMKKIVYETDEQDTVTKVKDDNIKKQSDKQNNEQTKKNPFAKETTTHQVKNKDLASTNTNTADRNPSVKVTTLRSSEAVKKAKALFENIASTSQKTKDTAYSKTTKLTDIIGVIKKAAKIDPALHPSMEDNVRNFDNDKVDTTPTTGSKDEPLQCTVNRMQQVTRDSDDKSQNSPAHFRAHSPEISRTKSPMRQVPETTTTKTVLSRYSTTERAESPKQVRPELERPHDKVPGYLRPTKTSQIKEEKSTELSDNEVSSRRGSGKFGVELRRTSVERSTVSSERRRSSVEHHQPCIEDIFDLDLLEQMLEKVVGYEQRRRIRAQIRVAKKKTENEQVDSSTLSRTSKLTTRVTKTKSPDRRPTYSPERHAKPSPQKTFSPDRQPKSTQKIFASDLGKPPSHMSPDRMESKESAKPALNGLGKEVGRASTEKRQRPHSPEKPISKSIPKSPARQLSPDKKPRPSSPAKTVTPKPKGNRFSEYASAYMKKVGLNESDKLKFSDVKTKKITEDKNRLRTERTMELWQATVSKSLSERTSSRGAIEIVRINGKRSPSPENFGLKPNSERKPQSPEREPQTPERKPKSPELDANIRVSKPKSPERKPLSPERTASSVISRHKSDTASKTEVIVKTVHDIEKKVQPKEHEDKPSWVTNRNLKKTSSETRNFSTKRIDSDKSKYRAASPSKVISKPIDVITSSYGPGPLDADGRPLFGIKALRNGASNYQVKGTVIRQEFHSRNGSEPEGTVSVTAYSTEPEDLEKLLRSQGERPSRMHGLAAITTTKKFGGDTGTTLGEVHNREEIAAFDQFTHSDRRVFETGTEISERRDQTHSKKERIEILDVSDVDRREGRHKQRDPLERVDTEAISAQDSRRGQRMSGDKIEKKSSVESSEGREERTERGERVERREDRKTVRQNSVKSLTEKFIKSAIETPKSERSAYPKAGLILRSAAMRDSASSDSSAHAGLARTDSEHSLASAEDAGERPGDGAPAGAPHARTQQGGQSGKKSSERSFLDSTTKVTGVQDILTRMKNADIVIEEGDSSADTEARALLNKFLGATVLMAGMQGYVAERPSGRVVVRQQPFDTPPGAGSPIPEPVLIRQDGCKPRTVAPVTSQNYKD